MVTFDSNTNDGFNYLADTEECSYTSCHRDSPESMAFCYEHTINSSVIEIDEDGRMEQTQSILPSPNGGNGGCPRCGYCPECGRGGGRHDPFGPHFYY